MATSTVGFFEHFRRLLDFKGREDRASFWPYAAFLFVASMVAMFALMIPEMMASMQRMQEFAAANPDQATVVSGPGHYSVSIEGEHPELAPDMTGMATATAIGSFVVLALFAAAVTRRLHDSGKSGFWGLIPVPFLAYSMIQMPRMFGSFGQGSEPDMGLFFSIFVSNMLYIIALIALIVLLARRSDPEPNLYDVQTTQ